MANAPELAIWMFIGILVIVLGVALAYGASRWSHREAIPKRGKRETVALSKSTTKPSGKIARSFHPEVGGQEERAFLRCGDVCG